MPPESSDKVDNKMEIKTKENCSEKLLIKSRGKKKSTKGKANGGQTGGFPCPPRAQPPKQLLNFEFLSSLKFLNFVLKKEKMIYSIMLSVRCMAQGFSFTHT